VGKFLKKMSDFVEERKESIKSKAFVGSFMTVERQYKLFFWCLNEYLLPKPSKKARLVWNSVIVNVIDSQYNKESIVIAKSIGKKKELNQEDIDWVKNELIPYFENSLEQQKGVISELMFGDIKKGILTPQETKQAYDYYIKNPKGFRR
jgi:hypothetical protein